jgi:DNA adenine methylase
MQKLVLEEIPKQSLKPPLKWAGGKRWLVPFLRPIWKAHSRRRLVEPMSGGLAVTLSLLPRRAFLNDINPHAINFYRWLKKGLDIDIPLKNKPDVYYAHRARFNELVTNGGANSREAAQFFYYLNRTCFNGLCRFNSKGEFNVPFGSYEQIAYIRDFNQYSELFADWELGSGDFQTVHLERGDFVYADPPYDVPFRQYSKEGFPWPDQERLAEWLAKHRGPVVLSNQATPRIVKLYKQFGFSISFRPAPRMISCTGDRSRVIEVIATMGI